MVLHTYAMLNENDICYGFTKLPKKYKKEDTPIWCGYLMKMTPISIGSMTDN